MIYKYIKNSPNKSPKDNLDDEDQYFINDGEILKEEEEFEEVDEWENDSGSTVELSYACEDCDYRWEESIDTSRAEEEDNAVCPMCGSTTVTQI